MPPLNAFPEEQQCSWCTQPMTLGAHGYACAACQDASPEPWRVAWRRGFAPSLSLPALQALAQALREDDPRLIQGHSYYPYLVPSRQSSHIEGCCAICYGPWRAEGLETVADLEDYFGKACSAAIEAVGHEDVPRDFLTWWDDQPRQEVRTELLQEVEQELRRRS